MSLTRTTRRSGLSLILLGVGCAVFFWLTDPHYGPIVGRGAGWFDPRSWLSAMRGAPSNTIDAINEAAIATWVGWTGAAALLLVGFWLVARRTV